MTNHEHYSYDVINTISDMIKNMQLSVVEDLNDIGSYRLSCLSVLSCEICGLNYLKGDYACDNARDKYIEDHPELLL